MNGEATESTARLLPGELAALLSITSDPSRSADEGRAEDPPPQGRPPGPIDGRRGRPTRECRCRGSRAFVTPESRRGRTNRCARSGWMGRHDAARYVARSAPSSTGIRASLPEEALAASALLAGDTPRRSLCARRSTWRSSQRRCRRTEAGSARLARRGIQRTRARAAYPSVSRGCGRRVVQLVDDDPADQIAQMVAHEVVQQRRCTWTRMTVRPGTEIGEQAADDAPGVVDAGDRAASTTSQRTGVGAPATSSAGSREARSVGIEEVAPSGPMSPSAVRRRATRGSGARSPALRPTPPCVGDSCGEHDTAATTPSPAGCRSRRRRRPRPRR